MSSLKRNISANFLGQIYVSLIGILCLPLYLKYLGAEAYGLVGFFTLLQAWLQLLDLGISPTLGREVARLKHAPEKAHQLRAVVRSLECIFVLISVVSGLALFLLRHRIAEDWLTVLELDLALVAQCVGLMAVMVGLRWLSALYKSGINAYEQQVWMVSVEAVLVSLRFPGSLLLLFVFPGQVLYFFAYQLVLTVVEFALLTAKFRQLLPLATAPLPLFSSQELVRVAPFAMGIAYTGGLWVLVTQLDKLILSKTLPLAEYGYFSLVATITGGLLLLSNPVGKALLPRMTSLLAQGKEAEMLALYRRATRLVVCVVAPLTIVISAYPKLVVYVWTGDTSAATWTADVLPMFVLGTGLLSVAGFQYFLQFAHGRIRQHVIYNTFSAALSVPMIIYSAITFGPVGVAAVWLGFRTLSFLLWSPYVHHLFAPGIHWSWITRDVAVPASVSLIGIPVLYVLVGQDGMHDRAAGLAALILATGCAAGLAVLASFWQDVRKRIHASHV
jgi:O-antigen/teichoic acid export membrane protein